MAASVSVIIPTYNRKAFLGRAIQSALSQCIAGDEVIVVDDGSTDGTDHWIRQFGDQVRYCRVPNGGAGKARNIGVELAKNDYIAFLDSDDEWFAGKLDTQRRLLDARPDVLFTFSDFAITHKDGRQERRFVRQWLEEPLSWDTGIGPSQPLSSVIELPASFADCPLHIGDTTLTQLTHTIVLTSSLLVRRCEAGDALRFAEDLNIFEDWFCFARLSLRGHAAFIDGETTWQHGAADERISAAGRQERAIAWDSINQRIWACDQAFLARYADQHRAAVRKNDITLARGLVAAGRTREARCRLANNPYASSTDRLLSRLPGRLARATAALRRRMRGAN